MLKPDVLARLLAAGAGLGCERGRGWGGRGEMSGQNFVFFCPARQADQRRGWGGGEGQSGRGCSVMIRCRPWM